MKKIMFLLPAIMLVMASLSAYSQKYKTAADSVNLNKEYVNVSNDVAELTSKLAIAQNNLPGYHSRTDEAVSNAKSTAIRSSEKASNAVNGDIGDARKAKRNAKRALKDAKQAQHVNNKEEDQNDKIAKLTSQLERKQQRLEELEAMRTDIRNMQPVN
jgi:chromosome segregation ATPase